MTPSPEWNAEQLEEDRQRAIADFVERRLREPIENYAREFDTAQGQVEDVLEALVDLTLLRDGDRDEARPVVRDILSDKKTLYTFRYLAGPPISEDDLKTVAVVESLARSRLAAEPDTIDRIVQAVYSSLDRRRFPWLMEDRHPAPQERSAAVLATAALVAYQRVQTARRHDEKNEQEDLVVEALKMTDFEQVPTRAIPNLTFAPRAGEFCRESEVSGRKADLVVGLYDGRTMLVECKVSNSGLNSKKRLNNDAAVKAETWKHDLGSVQVVPAAVLGGVYELHNLIDAQTRGLTLFWAHSIETLAEWAASTAP